MFNCKNCNDVVGGCPDCVTDWRTGKPSAASAGYELKPCPFCGGAAQCKVEEDHHGTFYSMGCSNSDCVAHEIYYTVPEEDLPMEQAVSNWNRRLI